MAKRAQAIGFPSWAGSMELAIAVGITYFLAARLSLALLEPDGVAVFWPAAGIASGVIIAFGRARLPVALGVMAATVTANLLGDRNIASAVVFALCNAAEAMLIAWLIDHHFGSGFSLDSPRRVLGFFLATAVGTAISGIGGTAGFLLFHSSDAPILTIWLNWFASDAIGVVTVAPLVIGLARTLHDPPEKSELMEGSLALVVLTLVSVIGFGAPPDYWFTIFPLTLIFPLLLWPAVHCRPVFAAAAAFILALAIVWTITFGIGRLGDPSLRLADRVHAAEAALLAISACALGLAALFAERRRNEAELKDGNRRLQLALDCAELGTWSLHLKTGRFENDVRDRRIHGHGTEAPPQTLAKMRSQVHPDDLSNLDTAFLALGRAGGNCRTEYRLAPSPNQERNGRERWIAIEGAVVRQADGQPVQLLGVTRDITERKLAEQALAERKAQLALAGKIALVGSFTFNLGSGRMQVSPGYAAIHGLPEGTAETSRADWRARVHPDDLPRLEANLRRDIDGGRSEHYCDYRIARSGGEIRWIEARSFILYDSDGAAERIVGANIDVTERKKAELTLAERTLQLALAERTTMVGTLAYDVDAEKMQISEGYAAIHGFPEGTTKIMRSEWQTGVHPEDAPRLEAVRCRAFRKRVNEYSADYRIVRPGGDIRWIEARSFIYYRGDGSPQRVVGVNIDITERKQTEDKLQKSERATRELLGALPAAIYVTDAAGHLTYCNQSAVDLWGVTPKLERDRWCDLARFYHADGTPMTLEDCPTAIALKQGRTVRGREAILERADGTRIPIAPYPTPMRDRTGAVVGVVNMTVDISERKQAGRMLAERDAQLALAGKFALVGTFTFDLDSERMQVSPGYATMHDWPEGTEDINRDDWRTGVHPEDLPCVEARFKQATADRRCEHYCEYRIVRSGGEIRWIDSRSLISYDHKGAARVVGANIDVTQRKQTEAALKEHKASLADALLAGQVMAFDWDAITGQSRRSDNAALILGIEQDRGDRLLRNEFIESVHPDDRRIVKTQVRQLCPSHPSYALIFRFCCPNGEQVWLEESAQGEFDAAGRLLRIKGLTRDITQRKKAELVLEERNVQLTLAAKTGLVGSYAYDIDTEMMQISEGYAAIHGFPERTAEIARSDCLATVHSDDIARVKRRRIEAFHEQRREYNVEYRIVRPSGELRWVETRCFISYDAVGYPKRVVGVSIDITERKRAEEHQCALVAELDHRVKNVLATVSAVAGQTLETSSSMNHFVAALDGRIRSMATAHELLSTRQWRGMPMAELVRREFAAYAGSNNTKIDGPEVVLSAEAGQAMGMVIHELVTNAAKYGALSTQSGHVSVRWYRKLNGSAQLVLVWQETGGPRVRAPTKTGYGTGVVRDLIPYEYGGTVDLSFAPEGVRCRLEIPFDRVSGDDRNASAPERLPNAGVSSVLAG